MPRKTPRSLGSHLASLAALLPVALCLLAAPNAALAGATPATQPQDVQQEPTLKLILVPICDDTVNADWWFKVPANMGPEPSVIYEVIKGEDFSIAPIFSGFAVNAEGEADVTFDILAYSQTGVPLFEHLSYIGLDKKIAVPGNLMLAKEIPRVSLGEDGDTGQINLLMTAHDNIAGTSTKEEVSIKLIRWAPKMEGPIEHSFSSWLQGYYTRVRPDQAVARFHRQFEVSLDKEQPAPQAWASFSFFRHSLGGSPRALDALQAEFESCSTNDRRRLALLFTMLQDFDRLEQLAKIDPATIVWVKGVRIPAVSDPIVNPVQLDMLWGEFFATGQYAPIRGLVNALANVEYSGSLEAYEASAKTQEDRRRAFLDTTYQAAVWSLKSNAKQHTRVQQYLQWTAESGQLEPNVQKALLEILYPK